MPKLFQDTSSKIKGATKNLPSRKQLRYLPSFLNKKEYLVIRICLLIALVAIIFLGWRIYKDNIILVPDQGGSYSEGLIGSPERVNPLYSSINDVDQDLTELIYSGLFKYNSDQELVGDLADSYEISEDQKIYTLHLRQGIKWQDGEDFNADDVIYTLQAIQDEEYKSPLAISFYGIELEKVDDYTVKITLPEAYTPFINNLTVGIIPEHLWFDITPANTALADLNLKPIGTGPFKFEKLTKDKNGFIRSYTLISNDSYYGQQPYIDELTFKFYPDFTQAIEALNKKNVDGLSYIPKEDREELKTSAGLNFRTLHLPQYTALFFNQSKNEALKELAVRQALAYAIDRQGIINQLLGGEGEVINTPILPGYIGHNPETVKYEYDPVMAKKTLDDAGWSLLEGEEKYKKGENELSITLTTVNQSENVKVAEMISDYWQEIGLRANLKIVDKTQMQKEIIKPREYEILLYGEIVGQDPDPYPFWHSSQNRHPGLNLAIFSNKKVDQLLEEARQTNDDEQRRLKYLHFQNIVAEQIPAILLYNPTYTYPLSQQIKGFNLLRINIPSDRFTNIENWYIKTQREWD